MIIDLTAKDEDKPCALHGKVISGNVLMNEGIALDKILTTEYSSVALELKEINNN